MAEQKEDMKITKFKVMVEEVGNYLFANRNQLSCWGVFKLDSRLIYCPAFIDKYIQDQYVNAFRDILVRSVAVFTSGTAPKDELSYIKAALAKSGIGINGHNVEEKEWELDRNSLIFWLLFLAAINEDLYNNELSSIIDLAYCLKFDEPMIRDWCHAVEYVLTGNHLNEECDLQCETSVGKQFFLHQEA